MKFHREFQNTNLTIPEAEKYTGLHLSSALGYGGGVGVFKLKQIFGVSI